MIIKRRSGECDGDGSCRKSDPVADALGDSQVQVDALKQALAILGRDLVDAQETIRRLARYYSASEAFLASNGSTPQARRIDLFEDLQVARDLCGGGK